MKHNISMHSIIRNVRIDRFTLFLATLSTLAICLVMARQITYGAGLGVDSSTYISVARNLMDGDGFVRWMNNEPYMRWPPLYPLLLVASSLFVFDPIDIAGLVNAIIFGATVFVAGNWLRERIASNFLAVWGCIAIALAIPLLQVAYTAMAEAPFILFTTLSLICTDKFLRSHKRSFLIWAAVFTALACLTRYIGVSLIIAVVPFLVLQHYAKTFEKIRLIATHLLIALIPLCLWILRNLLISQSFTGYNPSSNSYLADDVNDIFTGIATWALVGVPAEDVSFGVVILAGVSLISLTVAVASTAMRPRSDQDKWNGTTLFVVFILVYLVMLILSARATPIYPLSGRHITPIYIPLLLTSTFILYRFWSYDPVHKLLGTVADLPILNSIAPKKLRQITLSKIMLAVILVLWTMISVPANAIAISSANEALGPSKGVTRHFDSETLRYARENLIDGAMLTNLWIGHAYLFTDASAYHPLPSDHEDDLSVSQMHELRRFIETADDEVHVVWTYDSDNPHIRPNIDVLPEVKLVKEFADGIIYKVDKARWNTDIYEDTLTNDPVINSVFNVYLTDRNLIYIKERCSFNDLDASFFLHVFPANEDKPPESQGQFKSMFENLDFGFYAYGVKFEDTCMAIVPLPEYEITKISTGQFTSDARIWEAEIAFTE